VLATTAHPSADTCHYVYSRLRHPSLRVIPLHALHIVPSLLSLPEMPRPSSPPIAHPRRVDLLTAPAVSPSCGNYPVTPHGSPCLGPSASDTPCTARIDNRAWRRPHSSALRTAPSFCSDPPHLPTHSPTSRQTPHTALALSPTRDPISTAVLIRAPHSAAIPANVGRDPRPHAVSPALALALVLTYSRSCGPCNSDPSPSSPFRSL
jgi:hypothetical protein